MDQPEWTTVQGNFARLLLADQLPRNAFRGNGEAFAYDDLAATLSRSLVLDQAGEASGGDGGGGGGEVEPGGGLEATLVQLPAACLPFVCLPLMHSESLGDHDTLSAFLTSAAQRHPTYPYGQTVAFEQAHREVLERFGRYPHRNAKLGRESTPEEIEWLSGDIPGWAK